jgi:hypothetical protein
VPGFARFLDACSFVGWFLVPGLAGSWIGWFLDWLVLGLAGSWVGWFYNRVGWFLDWLVLLYVGLARFMGSLIPGLAGTRIHCFFG